MNSLMIGMPYIGKILSVNHYKFRGRFTKPEAKAWMDELGWKIKQYHIEDWKQPIRVTIAGVFKNLRSTPDLHNLLKITCDAIEETTGINDRYMETATKEPLIGAEEPELYITIEEVE